MGRWDRYRPSSQPGTLFTILPALPDKIDRDLQGRLESLQAGEMITVIVQLRERANLTDGRGLRRAQRLARAIQQLKATADGTQGPLRVFLRLRQRQGHVASFTPFWGFNGFSVTADAATVQELAAKPGVLSITPDAVDIVPVAGSLPELSNPGPNLSLISAPGLWNLGYTGQGVVVASMDSGVDLGHPELASRWRGGTNSWFDPFGQHPATPIDLSGHGTWTTGVMVAGDSGGSSIGVAPGAQWISVKIFSDQGSSTATAIHQGFQWLLDPDNDPATDDAPEVVNNSWAFGGPGCNLEFEPDLQALRAAGILPVFAAGNYGSSPSTDTSPANNPSGFAVGAINNNGLVYSLSSRGPTTCGDSTGVFPEVVAPGVRINTTDLGGYYTSVSGTSLSAPHVAGGLALLLSAYPDLTADQQQDALIASAVDLGVSGPDNTYGFGRPDLLAAFQWLAALPTETPTALSTFTLEPSFTPTSGATDTPTLTATQTSTPFPSATNTSTPLPTATSTFTPLPTSTATQSATPLPSATPTSPPTATPGTGFPSTNLLDMFNRSNGPIGANWSGNTSGYAIVSNQLDVGTTPDIYWNSAAFGQDQEAYLTLTTVDTNGSEIGLILKSQSNTSVSSMIEVVYNPVPHVIQVWTYSSSQNWQARGASIPVTLVNGDQFGARATASGNVEVYRNGTLLGTRSVTAWPSYAGSGYIGIFPMAASNTVIDNFGGGTRVTIPTSTPTATSTRTFTPIPPSATSTLNLPPSPTFTSLPSFTPTSAPTVTSTLTAVPSATPTILPTATRTATVVPANTFTPLPTNTATLPPTATATQTATTVPTFTFTPTLTVVVPTATNAPGAGVYFSTLGNTNPPGVGGSADDADIYFYDGSTFSRAVDASGTGSLLALPGAVNVDGFDRVDSNHFYLSFNGAVTLPGIGTVQDEDVVFYNAGAWSLFFDGSLNGLGGTDLDAISIAGGSLYFSTDDNDLPPGAGGSGDDADLYRWNGGSSYTRVFDASRAGFAGSTDVDGLVWVDATHFYLSFNTDGVALPGGAGTVQDEDIVYNNSSAWSIYFDGTAKGLTNNNQDIDAFDLP